MSDRSQTLWGCFFAKGAVPLQHEGMSSAHQLKFEMEYEEQNAADVFS